MTTRTSCAACGSIDLEIFLDLGRSPIADAYTSTVDEESPTYPLQVAVCPKCHLVQLLEVVPGEVLFGTGYSFYSSASAPLSAYHAEYAADVLGRYPELVKRGVVEIGCNDGDLLRHFRDFPHVGVDPSAGPVDMARQAWGLTVWQRPFGSAEADNVLGWFGSRKPGVVIANHVLAHVEDVSDFLAGVADLMGPDSIALIEVQYLPDLLVNNAFDLVYHEHRNFFSLTSLELAAGRHDLYVAEAHLTDRQGGSLRATLTRRPPIGSVPQVAAVKRSERWLDSFGAYEGLQGRAERIRWRLTSLISEQDDVAVYGAAAKTTTLLNFCLPSTRRLPFCVDTTPAKQGRFIPGVGIPILAPGDLDAETYVLGAWNYLGPIMRANPGHKWIVPIPAPVLVG